MKNVHLIVVALLTVLLYACNIIELEPKEDKVGKLLAQKNWVVVRSEDSITYPAIGSVYQFSEHLQTVRKKSNASAQNDSISVSPSEIRILTPPRKMTSVSIYHFDEDTLVITRGKNDDKSVYLLPVN